MLQLASREHFAVLRISRSRLDCRIELAACTNDLHLGGWHFGVSLWGYATVASSACAWAPTARADALFEHSRRAGAGG